MKIALSRSQPAFWLAYFAVHFSFLLILLFLVRWLWSLVIHRVYTFDLAEMAFESLIYAVFITAGRFIRHCISKRQYQKNPVDRRKNRMFRE